MNKVILMGRLTRDPEIRYTNGENALAIARFGLAVDRRFKRSGDSVDVDFFNCTAFGKQAEFVERYFRQGSRLLLTGRIQNDTYTNREGQKVTSVQIIAEELEFCESKSAGANRAAAMPAAGEAKPSAAVGDGFMNIPDGADDEELPFNF